MLVYVTITCPSDRITFGAYPRKEVITMRVGREINFLDTPPSDSITGAMLKNNSITNNKLSPGSVSGDKIDDYSINERHFNNDAVSSRAIATGGVDTRNIKSGALIISHMSAQFREFIENRGGLGGIKPAHHASTHGYGGLDRILPRDIGAAQREGESGVDFNTGALTATREVTGRSLHSQTDVTATQNIEAATDLIFGHELRTREFLEGILGFGFRSDQKGNVEAQSLKLRTFLETPELVKNQIRVIGTQAWLSESGVIARVSANPFLATGLTTADGRRLGTHYTGDYFVSFHDENANKWFRRDDILRGIYNYDSGFYTVFLRVMVCLSSGYVVRPLNGHAPTAEMVLVRQGNFTDPARQGAIYMDSAEGYIRVLGGMNSTEITNENLVAQMGNLRGLRVDGVELPADGLYAPGLAVDARNVAGLGAMFTVLEDAISSKVSDSEFESYITQTAKEIALKADKVVVDGLLDVKGLIRADKINTDNLMARQIDTRVDSKQGFVIQPGDNPFTAYDGDGRSAIELYIGNVTQGAVPSFCIRQNYGYCYLFSDHLYFNSGGARYSFGVDGVRLTGGVQFTGGGITLPPSATMDMPGVLAAGRVSARGVINGQWGCKDCDVVRYNGLVGRYKITHDIGHTKYFTTANLTNDGGFKGGVIIIEKQPNYVVLATYGLDNEFYDVDFEFQICGQN